MQQGQLNSQGVLAMQNIVHLVKNQEIQCDFQYYNMKYLADVPVLVFSEGKTMIPMHFRIPINTDNNTTEIIMETLKAAHHYLQPDRLDQFRRFITEAKLCEFSMDPENMEMIQTDYVQMRKDKIINSSDELHSLLTLSRLLAIARGKKVLDKESWELAKEMEHKRRERIKELPKFKPKV
ncbi:mini-chromosome maintenance complex-binding protein-like isoform X1 [Teleopsis dalmanni]|uniref:mini-chromosome maintenance complex-binding protein-like isoform X1 n=1 Tax=Teleopsis dalmanni TaxID=139649 RepID=UPI0018CF2CB1|nr:mini-chromosome maintenance complex-binding protein-like isoform X1 [Teleopsis dalmanni]